MNTIATQVHYQLVLSFICGSPNSYCSENFETKEAALDYFNREYKNRNKGDRYDEYWNNKNAFVQKVTTVTEVVVDDRAPNQIAEPFVYSIEDGYKYLDKDWSKKYRTKKDCIDAFIVDHSL